MPESHFYYSENGDKIFLRPSKDALSIAYKRELPPKDLKKLVRGDDQLARFIASPELKSLRIVLYKRGPSARVPMKRFAERIYRSPQIAYVSPVYYLNETPVIITDQFIASFKKNVTQSAIDDLNAANDVEVIEDPSLNLGPNTFLLRVRKPGMRGSLDMANRYFESGLSQYSEPNFIEIVSINSPFIPNDPLFRHQWHLPRISAPEAWDITQGNQVIVVAVLDEGVDTDHDDFASAAKFHMNHDFFSGDMDPRPTPHTPENHGTAVAGIATADANNRIGVTGVAPNCRLMALRITDAPPSGTPRARLVSAIRHAVDNGAAVLNNSWRTAPPLAAPIRRALDHAVNTGRTGKGCVLVFITGNDNLPVSTQSGPAAYQRTIAVGACTDGDVRADYSNYGTEINLCAPSDGGRNAITTTDRTGDTEGYNAPRATPPRRDPKRVDSDYTTQFGGTSAAAPQVAAVAALMVSENDNLTWDQVRYILEASADKIDSGNTDAVGRYRASGHSQWYGYGRLNAFEAVKGARSSVPDRDFVQRVTVTLRRVSGDCFVSTKVLHAIDARQRRAESVTDTFIRGGPDGFLRAELKVGPLDLSDEINVDR